jgi:3-phenylpropionate/trans-cinnamate dioxygenase ferredoxin subunit
MEKKYTWHKVAEHCNELFNSDQLLIEVEVAGKKVCIAKYREQLRGCASKCPHAGGKMSDGYIDALGNIVCPLHRYKFSLENGRNISGEGYFLKTYPVEERNDGVFIGFEEK